MLSSSSSPPIAEGACRRQRPCQPPSIPSHYSTPSPPTKVTTIRPPSLGHRQLPHPSLRRRWLIVASRGFSPSHLPPPPPPLHAMMLRRRRLIVASRRCRLIGRIVVVVSIIVKARHQRVRDGSRDGKNAWPFRSGAADALSGSLQMAFRRGHTWWKIFCDGFEVEVWSTTKETAAYGSEE